ncbi:BnaAnng34610D [Brassica napus]|uniref:BnaAnng34610D protein n=1 Tax=Brassica napus TaxID=3708 RepID=A0A078JYE4_BRANA|nr:BnaAnng34610D [Brassica napus]
MLGEKADPLADSLARRRRQDQQPLVQAVQSRGKLYKIRDEDVEFANSYCLATYGNWLFMVDYWYNLYLLNIFTHERIDLTPVESQLGTTKLERTLKAYSKKGDTKFMEDYQCKTCSHSLFNKYEQVDSLGNEAMLFDLGITVLANDDIVGGFKRNSIYYKTTCRGKNTTQICLFNFETKEMEPLHKFDCSSQEQLARSLWFLPSFKQT